MPWKVIEQDDHGEVKQIKYYPEECPKTGELRFCRLPFVCFRVQFIHTSAPDQIWSVTKTYRGFNIRCPDRWVYVSDSPTETRKKQVAGRAINGRDTTGCKPLSSFMTYAKNMLGEELARKITFLLLDAEKELKMGLVS